MKYAVMGTGMVGHALATKLYELGHGVVMGSRTADNEKAATWSVNRSDRARHADYADAAASSDVIIFATNGAALLSAAEMAGADNLDGKTVIDVTNPLDFSNGMPPTLLAEFSGNTSAAEQLQAQVPKARVVKALNTTNCKVMVDPARVGGPTDIFVCSDHDGAKQETVSLLKSFGWRNPIDLGGLDGARATESVMPFWLRLMSSLGTTDFNYKIVTKAG